METLRRRPPLPYETAMNKPIADHHPYALDLAAFRDLGRRTVDLAADYLEQLDSRPAVNVVPDDERRLLMGIALPDEGMQAHDMLAFLEQHVMPWPLPASHRRSYGWICSPSAPIAILADTIATTMNTGLDGYDHASLFLMQGLGRWFMELAGFPVDGNSLAVLFSGGSAANLNALTTALHSAARADGWNIREEGLQGSGRPPFTVYASEEVHSSVQKCCEQLGLGRRSLRIVPADDRFRLRPDALRALVESDRAAGMRPFCVVGVAGTTNVGAIDPLDAMADIAGEYGLWFHVDGAYGALGILDPAYADQYRGMERADTLTLDPHKWLHTPVDCGALLMRDRNAHREAFSLVPDYLSESGPDSAPWPSEHMFQLTYANRALKTWAAIGRLGRNGVVELVTRCNRLAAYLADRVERSPDLEMLAPCSLSVVNFRYVPTDEGMDDAALDALNRHISDAVAASGEAHMPTTKVRGRTALRACVLHYANTEEDMDHLVDLVRRLGREAVGR